VSFYPQIGRGSVAQFPLRRTRKWRAITNELESGERIVLPDSAAGQIEWYLKYTDLSDAEAQLLSALFGNCTGAYGAFVFIDPLANLLGWSEDLSRPDWQLGLMGQSGSVGDPMGTNRASSVSNGNPGSQQLSQTLEISGDYIACFSAWVRSDAAGTVSIQRDNAQTTVAIGPLWKRIYVSAAGAGGAAQSTFSIVLAAGQAVDVWGLQVEAQPYPSTYKQTQIARGIYDETYFGSDEMTVTNSGPGLSSCSIQLISRV